MLAKRFFYTCAWLLCLIATYQVATRSAAAQTCGQMLSIARFSKPGCYGLIAMDLSGQAYEQCGGAWEPTWRVPGTPAMLMTNPSDTREVFVLMDNGDVYWGHTDPGLSAWPPRLTGNVCAGPTSAHSSTWGHLKARYRTGGER
jgi:hypothetical protein